MDDTSRYLNPFPFSGSFAPFVDSVSFLGAFENEQAFGSISEHAFWSDAECEFQPWQQYLSMKSLVYAQGLA